MVAKRDADSLQFYTPEEVAEELHLRRRKVLEMCRAGELPSIKIGRQVRILSDWQGAVVTSGAVSEIAAATMNKRKRAAKRS